MKLIRLTFLALLGAGLFHQPLQAQIDDVADGLLNGAGTWDNAGPHPVAAESYIINSHTVTVDGTANPNFDAATGGITIQAGGTFEFDTGTSNGLTRNINTDLILDGGRILFSGTPSTAGNKTHRLDAENNAADTFVVTANGGRIDHQSNHRTNQFITYVIRSQGFTVDGTLVVDLDNGSTGAAPNNANAGGSRRIFEFENPRVDAGGTSDDITGTGLIRVLGNNVNDQFNIDANSAASDFVVSVPVALNDARLQFVGNNAAQVEMTANITNDPGSSNNFNNQLLVANVTATVSSAGNTYSGDTIVNGNSDLNVTGDIGSSRNLLDNGNNLGLHGTGTVGGIVFDGERGDANTRVKNTNVRVTIGDVNALVPVASTLTAEGNVLLGRGVRLSGNNTGNQPYLTDTVLEVDIFNNLMDATSNDSLVGDGANTLILNDILKPILQGAYAPVFGDQFQVFSNFASITLGQHFRLDTSMALLGPGLGWDTSLLQSQGILAVGAPEPGTTLPLLVLAAGLLACYRPRRARAMAETEAATPA